MGKMTAKRQTGLTLIELMVTISVASILLVLAVPGFQHVSAKMQRSAAVTGITGGIYFARSEAVKRGVTLTLCASDDGASCKSGADPEWSTGWILFEDADQDRLVDAGEEILRTRTFEDPQYSLSGDVNLAEGIVFTTSGFPQTGGQLAYAETGGSPSCSGTLDLNVVGRVKVDFDHDHCAW
jgi:type IV fimbrial biogenesis protein FimT